MPDYTPTDARVRAALRIARERAGMSQPTLARTLGERWSQTKVHRSESGGRRVTIADAEAWMRATHADPVATAEVLRLLEDAAIQTVTWGRLYELAGGIDAQQLEYMQREREATRIVVFQPVIVPGLAQTPEYARRVLELFGRSPEEIPAVIARRLERQRVLYEPGRDITFLVAEAALRLRVGPPGVLLEQIDRLVSLLDLPSVTLGVIPASTLVPSLPYSNYEVLIGPDDGRAYVEVLHGQVLTGGDEGTAAYLADFDKWLKVAAVGESARVEIARIRRGVV